MIEGLIQISTDDIKKYLDDSPIKFHLFACLYEIILNKLEWTESKRETLNHCLCYSDKFEKLTTMEAARKRDVTKAAVRMAIAALERDISDVIKIFKVLAPYYSYKSKYLSNAEIIRISPEVLNCIRREERVAEMTDSFIVRVLSVIYNYKMTADNTGGKEDYLLTQRGIAANKIIRFGCQEAERN